MAFRRYANGDIGNHNGGSGDEAGKGSNHRTIPQLTYHNNPNQAPYSERNSGGRPDGYFVRPSTAEFKDDTPAANTRKIFWSIHHIMRSDPCLFVTKAFNFILHEILIRFVAFNAYASAVDLGWDPTIHHIVSANSTVRYKITVHQCDTGGKVVKTDYLTTRLLYDSGAEARRRRGTWVFEAYRLEGSEEARAPVAIKDI
ncbi:hypothetical protein PILCRDRAFT_14574 [Piloderma croceum F 1598]|uniref:Fungal-type protein kinase domain-containing protein n=1 Tax=Piloderma croceum (strain F 1598) TaxID=765440 RepID=A0A0C3F2C9_PILCF|nr:hypothetical protein PILCRDRAFT_14574 [Piloderma croceum F 1598]